ncbi:MAG TPA: hypothetical protein VFB81_14775 [Myxococcales bacterium]|nr:hypothetical protein [Myxococcales bacterium]
MSLQDTVNALKRISEVAALAGIQTVVNEEAQRVEMGFGLDQGRSQVVCVKYMGKSPEDHDVITFFSPARVISKGFLKGMSRESAIELLRLNCNMMFARFGILESEKEVMIVASVDHLLDTLDPAELKHTALSVAIAADRYERKFGKDEF